MKPSRDWQLIAAAFLTARQNLSENPPSGKCGAVCSSGGADIIAGGQMPPNGGGRFRPQGLSHNSASSLSWERLDSVLNFLPGYPVNNRNSQFQILRIFYRILEFLPETQTTQTTPPCATSLSLRRSNPPGPVPSEVARHVVGGI